jgi:hypothetical protein
MTEAEWLACTNPTAMLAFVSARLKPRQLWLFACGCCRRRRRELDDPRIQALLDAVERQPESWPRTTGEVVQVLADLHAREAEARAALNQATRASEEARHQAREADMPPVPSAVLLAAVENAACIATLAAAEAAHQAGQALAHSFFNGLDLPNLTESLAEAAGLAQSADAWSRCAGAWQRRADREDDRPPKRGRSARAIRVTVVRQWIEDAEEEEADRIGARTRGWATRERAAQAGLLRCIAGSPFGPPPVIDPRVLAWGDGTVRRLAAGIYEDRAFERLGILADALEEAGCVDERLLGHCRERGEHARGCWVVDAVLPLP